MLWPLSLEAVGVQNKPKGLILEKMKGEANVGNTGEVLQGLLFENWTNLP